MNRFLFLMLLAGVLADPFAVRAQTSVSGVIGYGIGKFVYRPANLDIVRYNLDQDSNEPMDFPDYIKGMSYGMRINFNEYTCGEFFYHRRKATGSVMTVNPAGDSTAYDLRCSVSSINFGAAAGVRFIKAGMAFHMGSFAVTWKRNDGDWENVFEHRRKIWFGHSFYLSLLLPLGKACVLEARPYWEISWASVRMGHSQPLIAFRPSNFGVMFAIGLGSSN